MFANVGVSKPPRTGDGYAEVKRAHDDNIPMFVDADDVTTGPIQTMLNSNRFRPRFAESLQTDTIIYLHYDRRLSIIVADKTWNAIFLLAELKKLVLDAAGTKHARFYFTIASGEGTEEIADVHWVGIELVRGPVRDGPIAILYDPGACKSTRPTWFGSKPVQYGLLLPLVSDPEVRKAFDWGETPEIWGKFIGRRRALRAAEMAALRSEGLRKRYGSEAGSELLSLLPALGVRAFEPKIFACQTDHSDYFCQIWVLYLFRERALGHQPAEIERDVDILGKEGILRITLIAFVKAAVRSDIASVYWKERMPIPRVDGGQTMGDDFYAWLLHAIKHRDFGRCYLEGRLAEGRIARMEREMDQIHLL